MLQVLSKILAYTDHQELGLKHLKALTLVVDFIVVPLCGMMSMSHQLHEKSYMPNILIAAGGTGGHIFPGLVVAEKMQEAGYSPHWLGTRQGLEAKIIPQHHIPIHYLTVTGLRGKGLATWLLAPFRLMLALWQCLVLIYRLKPKMVLGMGGFVSGPAGIACWLTRTPLVIHEQNAVAGTTNRILARIASRTLQAFPNSFPRHISAISTGNPVRNDLSQIALQRKSAEGPLHILILGGSRGAMVFNQQLPGIMAALSKQVEIEIWHQTGDRLYKETNRAYSRANVTATVSPFIDDMSAAYRWAHLVICRAGALTVAEVQMAGLPSILIPFPHAIDDHQTKNANILVQQRAGILIQQENMTQDELVFEIARLAKDRSLLKTMGENARQTAFPHAADNITAHCLEVCGVKAS